MNRSPMPQPDPAKHLARRVPLKRTPPGESVRRVPGVQVPLRQGLSRAPLRRESARRTAENRQRRKMLASMFPERPLCVVYELSQRNPGLIPDKVISRCGRWADDAHEPLTRARGGSITDPENVVPPCRSCHDALGLEPSWGYALGLIVHSWDAPKAGEVA